MMGNFEKFIEDKLVELNQKHNKKMRIGFVEGWSLRMQKAAAQLSVNSLITPILIFETREQYSKREIDSSVEVLIIEEEQVLVEELGKKYFELRKGKETEEQIAPKMKKAPLFAATLLKVGQLNGAVGGVYNSTAEILRSAFKAVGPAEGIKTISSVMLMHKENSFFTFSDISVNPNPGKSQLVDIAVNASNFVKSMGKEDKVAFLSFSTDGSAKTEETVKMANATEEFNKKYNPKNKAIGEVQFDAAFNTDIRKSKYKKDGAFEGVATIYIFPDLGSGNIGYKIAQRMGNWGAIGPIITGLKLPFNDLSRGSKTNDVLNTAIITAIQAHSKENNE